MIQGLPGSGFLPLSEFPLSDNNLIIPTYKEVLETLDVFEEIIVKGFVLNPEGIPVTGALVEIWHAAQWGVFGMEYGPSFAPYDPDEQMWACTVTDENGAYFFKTLKRPFHAAPPSVSIDIKVTDENTNVTLSKLYLNEDISDPADSFLMDMELEERKRYFGEEEDGGACKFNIVAQPLGING